MVFRSTAFFKNAVQYDSSFPIPLFESAQDFAFIGFGCVYQCMTYFRVLSSFYQLEAIAMRRNINHLHTKQCIFGSHRVIRLARPIRFEPFTLKCRQACWYALQTEPKIMLYIDLRTPIHLILLQLSLKLWITTVRLYNGRVPIFFSCSHCTILISVCWASFGKHNQPRTYRASSGGKGPLIHNRLCPCWTV